MIPKPQILVVIGVVINYLQQAQCLLFGQLWRQPLFQFRYLNIINWILCYVFLIHAPPEKYHQGFVVADECIRPPLPVRSTKQKKLTNVLIVYFGKLSDFCKATKEAYNLLIPPYCCFGITPNIRRVIVELLRQYFYIHNDCVISAMVMSLEFVMEPLAGIEPATYSFICTPIS